MVLEKLVVGAFQVNCYILASKEGGDGLIIDPGGDAEFIIDVIRKKRLNILYIIATHAHIDHIYALERIKRFCGADFLLHRNDVPFLSDPQLNLSSLLQVPYTFPHPERLLEDGDCIHLEGMTLEVLHTPGHTPGSICLSYDDILFTGDTLFAGGVGRVDFPGGNLQLLLSSIKRRIFSLPETMKVLPGHGPESTIEKEKRENFFLK